ncbi:MAG TPA: hypothetical protein VFH78_08900 [Candidatus Thermoplasmatota archaeon]|nr:hypothetical protein [Candidatus Thermoplasmatota archaeon]
MASLDVLDYQAGLDGELARAGMPAALRRQAVKDARRVVDAMAFRFALMDERPLPEDLDYLRALEALKPPPRAAPVLLARRPHYARVRRRRLTTTWTILLVLATAIGGLAYLATSEEAEELVLISLDTTQMLTFSSERSFEVTENMTRLHIDGTFLINRDSRGVIEARLVDPAGQTRMFESFYPNGNVYLRENIYEPEPGEWTLIVDFLDARGSVRVTVDGIRPTR